MANRIYEGCVYESTVYKYKINKSIRTVIRPIWLCTLNLPGPINSIYFILSKFEFWPKVVFWYFDTVFRRFCLVIMSALSACPYQAWAGHYSAILRRNPSTSSRTFAEKNLGNSVDDGVRDNGGMCRKAFLTDREGKKKTAFNTTTLENDCTNNWY